MRVLHLAKFYPPYSGGMETFLRDLAVSTTSMGVENHILAHNSGPNAKTLSTECVEGVAVTRVPTFGSLLYAPVAPSYPFHLRRLVRQFSPDVVHVHMPNLSAFSCLTPLFVSGGVPLVVHWHSDVIFPAEKIVHRAAYAGYQIPERMLLRKAARIIVTSPQYREASVTLAPFANTCDVIPLGLDVARLPRSDDDMPDGVNLSPDEVLFFSIGRFSHYKGFSVLVDAFSRILTQQSNNASSGTNEGGAGTSSRLRLVIAGSGEELPAIRRVVENKGLTDRIILTGRVTDAQLAALMHRADVFCLPSVERTEAFGMVLLEAMACGTPLISSAIEGSGVCHVNAHGESGLQVPPANAEALAKAILRLYLHPEERKRLGTGAKERFERMFRIESVASRVCSLYQEVCG